MNTFQAKISVYDPIKKIWKMKKNPSNMFPVTWSEKRIQKEIISAFQNPVSIEGIKWQGISESGLKIEGFLRDGIIESAYPAFDL